MQNTKYKIQMQLPILQNWWLDSRGRQCWGFRKTTDLPAFLFHNVSLIQDLTEYVKDLRGRACEWEIQVRWCLTLWAISLSNTRRTPWLFTWSTALEKQGKSRNEKRSLMEEYHEWKFVLNNIPPLDLCCSSRLWSYVCHSQEDWVRVSTWTQVGKNS